MNKDYDDLIQEHYRKVAEKHGLSSASTMEDNYMRTRETEAIIRFVHHCLETRFTGQQITIMDIGCGNGYTLEVLAKHFPGHHFVGIEKTDELRSLAAARFEGQPAVRILPGDIRQPGFQQGIQADILICQRVFINLLDPQDQIRARENVASALRQPQTDRSGALALFIEGFTEPLVRLNIAREELGLEPIAPAYHNLYMPEGFFETAHLAAYTHDRLLPANFLSTHYYLTRVLFPYHTQGKPLKRNSEFVSFFTQALPECVGDYSPVKAVYCAASA